MGYVGGLGAQVDGKLTAAVERRRSQSFINNRNPEFLASRWRKVYAQAVQQENKAFDEFDALLFGSSSSRQSGAAEVRTAVSMQDMMSD